MSTALPYINTRMARLGVLLALLFPAAVFLVRGDVGITFAFLLALAVTETASFMVVRTLRERFQWLITPRDFYPDIDYQGLHRFAEHGYDPELGWVRKPGTSKEEIGQGSLVRYHINAEGSRVNPGHEDLPRLISLYGDSFAFSRQMPDSSTLQWHLSEISGTNVLNFGVGNYGMDQALLRLRREYKENPTPIVVMGVVPSTIVRIHCIWKHYNEYGNIFGFKPRFVLHGGNLRIIQNPINRLDKFFRYKQYLPWIQKNDIFFETKFKRDMLRFPYLASILARPSRNLPLIALTAWDRLFPGKVGLRVYPRAMSLVMRANLLLRVGMFRRRETVGLLEALTEEFIETGRRMGFSPVLLLMPQKDDVLHIRKHGHYYADFVAWATKRLAVIDITPVFAETSNIDILYCDDNRYGGHFSEAGNAFVARTAAMEMMRLGILDRTEITVGRFNGQ